MIKNPDILFTTMEKIEEISKGVALRIIDQGAKEQVERIAGIARFSLEKCQEKPDANTKEAKS